MLLKTGFYPKQQGHHQRIRLAVPTMPSTLRWQRLGLLQKADAILCYLRRQHSLCCKIRGYIRLKRSKTKLLQSPGSTDETNTVQAR